MTPFAPIVPQNVPCKCCGSISGIYGVVDFNKNCEAGKNRFPLPYSGIPIYYHRCPSCGLIFTVAFDEFSREDFVAHIYNETYALVDPDYADFRPTNMARKILEAFGQTPAIRILDYGGGNGVFEKRLRAVGFSSVQTYDPFVPEYANFPTGKFQLITCVEVVEHSLRPLETFKEMAGLLDGDGLIFIATGTQPPNIEKIGLHWWYASPRNGHVTLYSQQALERVAASLSMKYAAAGTNMHVLFRKQLPEFARHLMSSQ